MLKPWIDYDRNCYAIDDKHNVIAYENGGYEHILMPGKASYYAADETSLALINAYAHLARLHECYLYSGENAGEDYCDYSENYS